MRSNRKQHRRFLEAPCRRRTTDASTVFATSMFGYLHLSFGRTVGKKFPDSFGKLFHVISIELPLSLSLPVSAALSGFSISHHSASACSNAFSSTKSPCRSYRPRALLNFRTTAESTECFRARLVSAASPVGRKTNWSRSAQARHNAPSPSSSLIHAFLPNSSPHSSHLESRCEMKTLMSSDFFTGAFEVPKVIAMARDKNDVIDR